MSFLTHPVVYFILYVLLMIPTYILPYFGSNSAVFGVASVAAGRGVYPLFFVHFAFLAALVGLAWIRGARVGREWLAVFPGLALVFDLAPGLNWIPMIPTTMHLLAIIVGVVGTSTQPNPAGAYALNRGTNSALTEGAVRENMRTSPLEEVTASQEAGRVSISEAFANRAKPSSTAQWVKPAGLASLGVIFVLLLLEAFGAFNILRPDTGSSQVGSLKPPVPTSLPAVGAADQEFTGSLRRTPRGPLTATFNVGTAPLQGNRVLIDNRSDHKIGVVHWT